METAITLIQTLGFPIACVIALSFFIYKSWQRDNQKEEQNREYYEKQADAAAARNLVREDKLIKQIDDFNETMNKFNVTLIKIDTRLETLEKTVQ